MMKYNSYFNIKLCIGYWLSVRYMARNSEDKLK